MNIIDSHIHICRCINGFGNSGEMQAIGGGYASYADGTIFQMIPECLGEYDVTPKAVLKVMDEAGVSKAVMLQGNFLGPQNLYTYEAAKKYPDRLAAAATYDPFCRNVDSIRKHLFEDLGIKIVKFEISTGSGLMSYHPTIPLDGDVIEEMLSYAEMHNNTVVFDIGRYPAECWQPEALARAIKRHPDTQFVVCHLLAPRGLVQENVWLKGMEALTLDNVVFDLASLPSNQGKDARYPYPDAIHYIKRAIELVGSDRLMWGSDLPMNLCKDSYRHLIDYIVLSNEISTPDKENIMAATADRVPCIYIENGKVANYDPSAPIEVSYQKPFPGEPLGKDHPELLYNMKHSHGHDMAIVNGIGRIGYMKGGGKALWKDENIADSITAHAIDFIDKYKNQPFFLYFATNDVHVPRFPHERFRGKNKMGVRGDAIAQFDWTVGQIIAALEERGLRENTLIILSSDNGPVVDDGYDDHAEELLNGHSPAGPFRGNKYSAFEGGTAVPAIVSWPKEIPGSQISDALVSQIDWFASMAALINAKLPKGSAPDSQNRLNTWLGKDQTDRPWIIEESSTMSVRTKNWKYIEPNDGPAMITWGPKVETGNLKTPQLYDMRVREYEKENLADQHPEIVYEMQNILRRVRK